MPTVEFEFPEDGALRGLFGIRDGDSRNAARTNTGLRKNVDFLRLKDTAILMLGHLVGKKILDIGCSTGANMIWCGLQGASVCGQDLDESNIEIAKRLMARHKIKGETVVGDARHLQFPDDYFDAVIASDFLEHIDDPSKIQVLSEVRRVLRPGAPLVIKTPNLAYLRLSKLYKQLGALLRFKNPFQIVIPHTPGSGNEEDRGHIGLTTRWALSDCLEQAGFQNYQFVYLPLRRFGRRYLVDILSAETPILRDLFCEDLFCKAAKPVALSHFPD